MERFSRSGILIARVMISVVFLLNALGVIDQTEAARELAAQTLAVVRDSMGLAAPRHTRTLR